MKELWFKTNKNGSYKPFKLVLENGNIIYKSRQKLFNHIVSNETLKYFRVKEDGTIIKKLLHVQDKFLNDMNVMTLQGDFEDIKES